MRRIIALAVIFSVLLSGNSYGVVFFCQEPSQYVTAQANPTPAPTAKPVLDTSGIQVIQSIPVGKASRYPLRETIEELGLEGYIPMELILESLANLALMQMGLVGLDKFNVYRNKEPLPEGTFGWALQQILGIDPRRDFGLSVEHRYFKQRPSRKEDCYELTINFRRIEVILTNFEGYEWGIRGLVLRQRIQGSRPTTGIPYAEERELVIDQVESARNPGRFVFGAIYTVRTIANDGSLIAMRQYNFMQGHSKAYGYREEER